MQRILNFLLAITIGVAFAAGAAFIIHLWFPRLAVLVFLVISLYWLWTGWRYAVIRDQFSAPQSELARAVEALLSADLSARRNELVSALGAAVERGGQRSEQYPISLNKILLCVTGEGTAQGFTILLEKWGYRVETAVNLSALLKKLEQSDFDLVIVDVCDSEIELNIDGLLKLPYRFLVVGCDRNLHGQQIPSGFNNFLHKPVEVGAFKQKIEELMA
jgi:CheY-like chemotaxis protein